MAEITNANDVQLTVTPRDGTRFDLTQASETPTGARIAVDNFNFTFTEDNQLVGGVGNHTPVGITRGNVEYEFSFTVMGEDGSMLGAVALDDGRAREIEFLAVTEQGTVKMTVGYLTSLSYDGSDGEAVEYSVEGVAVEATIDY